MLVLGLTRLGTGDMLRKLVRKSRSKFYVREKTTVISLKAEDALHLQDRARITPW